MGADIMAGSLIKNPGGGIAPTGGYIVGREELVEAAAMRLTCPGIGRECGCSQDVNRLLYQGFFHGAPCDGTGTENSGILRRSHGGKGL